MSVRLHLTYTQPPHSLPCGFLHYCSCASIRYLPKLHIVPSVTTTLPKNFKLLRTFLFHCRIHEHNIFFLYFFNETSMFKARIGKLN